MTALLEKTGTGRDESFFIGIFQDNLEEITWHYHNNYEISFITEGSGKRIVGDSIEEFQPGDLVFIGPNLPHIWIADKEWAGLSKRTLEMVFLQFTSDMLNEQILNLPEFRNVVRALALSQRGIHIVGQTLNEVSELMLQMPYLEGFEKMIHFLRIMDIIGNSQSNIPLASQEYQNNRFTSGSKRIAAIHEYIMKHYKEEVCLEKIADLVNMAKGSICRFFKEQTGLTLFEYLNKVKVEFACNLLMNRDLNMADICYDSGFSNLSHFNKQFRKVTGMTPSVYRKLLFRKSWN